MTRSERDRILSRGRLFCDFWVVGYFLGLSWNQVDHLYESGQLPKALCPDGSEYRPAGERLVSADEFASLVPEERQVAFAGWRSGRIDIAPAASRTEVPAFDLGMEESVSSADPLTVTPQEGHETDYAGPWTWADSPVLTVQPRNQCPAGEGR